MTRPAAQTRQEEIRAHILDALASGALAAGKTMGFVVVGFLVLLVAVHHIVARSLRSSARAQERRSEGKGEKDEGDPAGNSAEADGAVE